MDFQTIAIEFAKKKQEKILNGLILFISQLKTQKKKSLCYYSVDVSKAYCNTYSVSDSEKLKHGFAYECYYCVKFFTWPDGHKKHMENCAGIPGVIYNFNKKNLINFEDTFGSKGDLPFAMYFDFETTAPTDNIFDPEQKKMFVVSYVLLVAFHPKLNLKKIIIIQRSFGHLLKELAIINYLTEDQMQFIDIQILNQLEDIAIDVRKRKCKNTIVQMFCIESAFVKKSLAAWFNKKN